MTRREAMVAGVSGLLATFIRPERRREIDLSAFCGRREYRGWDITRPYHLNDWTYATNMAACVRVEPRGGDEVAGRGHVPPFESLSWNHDRLRGWMPLPDATPTPAAYSACPACDGYGLVPPAVGQECGACEGMGKDYFARGWTGLGPAPKCRACDGRGWVGGPVCPACGGKAIGVHPSIVCVGGVYYDAALYGRVRALGGEFVPDFWRGCASAPMLKFRFDGGLGLLMGLEQARAEMRIREAKHG